MNFTSSDDNNKEVIFVEKYKIAEIDDTFIKRIRKLEEDIKNQIGQEITLIAYSHDSDNADNPGIND